MSDVFQRPILKQGRKYEVRILRPSEYVILRTYSEQPDLLDGALATGMRYVELQRFQNNPAWFDGNRFVYLPREASKKALGVTSTGERRPRSQLNRFVKLSDWGASKIAGFLRARKLPTWETWTAWMREWAKRSGLDPQGLGPKTTRKTLESWTTFYYGQNRLLEIVQSQGHNTGTSLHHYLSMPFLAQDRKEMEPFVAGMF